MVRSGGDLANCCINIPIDDNNVVDADLIYHSAQVVKELGETTERGEGNFHHTIVGLKIHLQKYIWTLRQ